MTDSNVGEIGTLHSEIGTSEFKMETPDLIIVDEIHPLYIVIR